MSLAILQPGLLTTIQDGGRWGRQKIGVIPSGAMDRYSLRLANLLVGNEEYGAALEITLAGPVIRFTEDTLIALTGGDLSPTIGGAAVPMLRPVAVRAGTVLRFGPCRTGCRAYLAAAGSLAVPAIMGSRSASLRSGLPGLAGRALRRGDALPAGRPSEQARALLRRLLAESAAPFAAAHWFLAETHVTEHRLQKPLRVMAGLQYEQFTEEARRSFFHTEWTVTASSDRMGYRLSGGRLALRAPLEMVSEAAATGTVQVPPGGEPILLMADHQTTAGYPVIGQVALVDAARAAQKKPGDRLSFRLITRDEAERLFLDMERAMDTVRRAVKDHF